MDKTGVNICVLDDQKSVLMQIEQALKRAGIKHCRTFTDADEFVNAIDENVHIAIIDYFLAGDMTGVDVCKVIHKKNLFTFIIIVSGQDEKNVVKLFMNYGAKRYVEKVGDRWVYELVDFVKEAIEEINRKMSLFAKLLSIQSRYEK